MKKFAMVALGGLMCTEALAKRTHDAEEDLNSKDMHYSDKASYNHDQEVMLWYIQAMRGSWFGFYRGFFHDKKKPQSQCLSANMEDEVAEVMQWLAYGELYDIFKVADSMTNLYYDNRLGCGYRDITSAINKKCTETDDSGNGICTLGNYAYNLSTTHMIESMG